VLLPLAGKSKFKAISIGAAGYGIAAAALL
jgi:hypothetical protein